MNCFDQIKRLLQEAPSTAPELAFECGITTRAMNSRLQFYKYRGLVKHNGRLAPKRDGDGVGRRAKFWVLA